MALADGAAVLADGSASKTSYIHPRKPLYSTAHQPLAHGWKEVSTASFGTEATTGAWVDGALRKWAAIVAFQVLEASSLGFLKGCSFAIAGPAKAAAAASAKAGKRLRKRKFRRHFFTADFPKAVTQDKALAPGNRVFRKEPEYISGINYFSISGSPPLPPPCPDNAE